MSSFLPREHGATAMLLIPFFSAAILAREWRWTELAALLAVFCAFAAKDPLVVLARQRWVWKQPHPETQLARKWLLAESLILAVCGAVLVSTWPLTALLAIGLGATAFSAIAIVVTVKNRQRSSLFQIASAIALSSTSIAAGLSANGAIQPWCWQLWALCALQATAGILVVHSRLEARIAVRKGGMRNIYLVPAIIACLVLLSASSIAGFLRAIAIMTALLITAAFYLQDLREQRDPVSLQKPLVKVGLQNLTVSIAFSLLVIVGLW